MGDLNWIICALGFLFFFPLPINVLLQKNAVSLILINLIWNRHHSVVLYSCPVHVLLIWNVVFRTQVEGHSGVALRVSAPRTVDRGRPPLGAVLSLGEYVLQPHYSECMCVCVCVCVQNVNREGFSYKIMQTHLHSPHQRDRCNNSARIFPMHWMASYVDSVISFWGWF